MKRNLGFSKQILLILISTSVICVSITGFIGYTIAKKSNEKLVLDKLNIATESTYNLIDSAVNTSIRNYLKAISEKNLNIVELYYKLYQNGTLSEVEAKQDVAKIISSQTVGNSGYIYIVDSNGNLKVHPKLKNTNLLKFNFIKDQIKMKHGYIEYTWKNPEETSSRAKVLYMTYFKPWDYIISVSSYKSEFTQLVDISDFRKNILSVTLGRTGYQFILNSKGDLIIHPKQEGVNIYNSEDTYGNYFIRNIIKNKNGQIIYPWQNPGDKSSRDKIVVYKYYKPMDWYICSGVYLDELYEPITLLKNALIFSFGFILIIAIIISIIYGRIIINPIIKLTNAASKILDGNFDIEFDNPRNDEIGRLTSIFNHMVIKLRHTMENLHNTNQQLEEMNVNLENKVVERTKQLNSNYTILEKEIFERIKAEELLEIKYNELQEIKEKLEIANKQLETLSTIDALTGVPNRRYLDEFLRHEWSICIDKKTPISIVMIDIDFFKNFNDTYGHLAGDRCLKQIATEINNSIDTTLEFAARYGGEEFLVILPHAEKHQANIKAELIRKNIENLNIPHISSKISTHVTASLGITTTNGYTNQLLDDFIKCADEALYKAKQEGRNKAIHIDFS